MKNREARFNRAMSLARLAISTPETEEARSAALTAIRELAAVGTSFSIKPDVARGTRSPTPPSPAPAPQPTQSRPVTTKRMSRLQWFALEHAKTTFGEASVRRWPRLTGGVTWAYGSCICCLAILTAMHTLVVRHGLVAGVLVMTVVASAAARGATLMRRALQPGATARNDAPHV